MSNEKIIAELKSKENSVFNVNDKRLGKNPIHLNNLNEALDKARAEGENSQKDYNVSQYGSGFEDASKRDLNKKKEQVRKLKMCLINTGFDGHSFVMTKIDEIFPECVEK